MKNVEMKAIRWPWPTLEAAKNDGAVVRFHDEWKFLSNMHRTPVQVCGTIMPATENGYVLGKLDPVTIGEKAVLEKIADAFAGFNANVTTALRKLCENGDVPKGQAMMMVAKAVADLSPYEAKKIGRSFPLRDDWMDVHWKVMAVLQERKYAPNSELARKLLATGDRPLLEGNTWGDRTWGVIDTRAGLEGLNALGRLLMRQREALGGAGAPEGLDAVKPVPFEPM